MLDWKNRKTTYDANGNTTFSASIQNFRDFDDRMLTHDWNRVSETIGGTTTGYLVDNHNLTGLQQLLDQLVNGSVAR